MHPSVHEDRSIGVWSADVEDVNALQFGEIHELDAVWRQELPGNPRRLATGVGFELVLLSVVEDRSRPRLEGDGALEGLPAAAARQPDAFFRRRRSAQDDLAVR